jgi:hypothetical protein
MADAIPSSTAPVRRRRLLFSLRYVVPAVVCLAGVVVLLVAGADGYGPDALAGLLGAGGAIYLMNKFMRMGIAGDADRDVEEARRMFLDRYRMWPDEVPAGWVPPDGYPDAHAAFDALVEQRRRSDVAA